MDIIQNCNTLVQNFVSEVFPIRKCVRLESFDHFTIKWPEAGS